MLFISFTVSVEYSSAIYKATFAELRNQHHQAEDILMKEQKLPGLKKMRSFVKRTVSINNVYLNDISQQNRKIIKRNGKRFYMPHNLHRGITSSKHFQC